MPKDVDGIIDEIDRLVDESLSQPIVDDYSVNRYDRCWHCNQQWHGFPLTERVLEMQARRVFDENYRIGEDDSPVWCPGSDFIGPVQHLPSWQMRVGSARIGDPDPLQRVERRIRAIHEAMVQLMGWTEPATAALRSFSESLASQAQWWRIVLPRGATITMRADGVEIGVGSLTETFPDVRVRTAGQEGINLLERVNRAARRAWRFGRVEVDVLAVLAPFIGGTWTPLTAPGVTRHPDGEQSALVTRDDLFGNLLDEPLSEEDAALARGVRRAIDGLNDAAPPALDTLNELAQVMTRGEIPDGFQALGRMSENGIERRPRIDRATGSIS